MKNEIRESKLSYKTLKIISISIGFSFSFLILEIISRIAPATDVFPLEKPILCEQNSEIKLKCLHRKKPFTKGTWSAGKFYPFNEMAFKESNDIGQFSDVNFDDFLNKKDKSIKILSIGDSIVEALQVKNSETFHGILNKKNLNNNYPIISTAIGSAGYAFPNFINSLKFANKKEVLKESIVIMTITPNDFYESFLEYGRKGRRNGLGQFFFQEGKNDFIFIPFKKKQIFINNFIDFLIKNSSLTRYFVYNLKIGEIIKKRVFFFNYGTNHNKPILKDKNLNNEKYRLSNIAMKKFFKEINLIRKNKVERERTIFVISYLGDSIFKENEIYNTKVNKLLLESFAKSATSFGYSVIDMKPVFLKDFEINQKKFNSPYDSHWNQHGHRIVSETILKKVNSINNKKKLTF